MRVKDNENDKENPSKVSKEDIPKAERLGTSFDKDMSNQANKGLAMRGKAPRDLEDSKGKRDIRPR